ncbi:MAG: Smr/MutS family protein [bacterium]|nr:Smr/MutS family protein [bacterium]
MFGNIREREKLELSLILEEFKKNSLLNSTKEKFDNLNYIKDKEEYSKFKDIVTNYNKKIFLKLPFTGFSKIDEITERIKDLNGHLQESDLFEIKSSIDYTLKFFKTDKNYFFSFFDFQFDINKVYLFKDNIERIVDDDGKIKDEASSKLLHIRKNINKLLSSQDRIISKILKKYEKYLTESNITLVDNRIVLQVDVHEKNRVKGVFHSYSNTKRTVFIEPEELVFLNNRLNELKEEERLEIAKILEELKNSILSDLSIFSIFSTFISKVDFINSTLLFMNEYDANFVQIEEEIELIRVYHPIIKKVKGKDAKPVNIKIEKNRSLLITGPNMGGKTAVLKTVGVSALLTKLGLPICSSEFSKIRLFDKIFCDIGDDQSLENGISTFASHLLNYKNIVENCDENSLILLDEVGTGTSIKEGTSFAISLIKTFLEKGSTLVFTTHYDPIKDFSLKNGSISCCAMKYDFENNIPYFELEYGTVGQSGMFSLLKKYGFPEKIIEESYKTVGKDFLDYTQLIKDYQLKIEKLESEREKLELLKKSQMKIEEITKKELDDYLDKKNIMEKEYRKRINEKIESLRSEFEKVVRELTESKERVQKKEIIKNFRKFLDENIVIKEVEKAQSKENLTIKIGDTVQLRDKIEGIVKDVDGDRVSIDINGVILKTNFSNIVNIVEKKNGVEKRYHLGEEIKEEIDLRGKFSDEALEELENYILKASASGIKRVRVIHGHGKGILKDKIRSFLKGVKFVKGFSPAPLDEGGDGVTIIEFF